MNVIKKLPLEDKQASLNLVSMDLGFDFSLSVKVWLTFLRNPIHTAKK